MSIVGTELHEETEEEEAGPHRRQSLHRLGKGHKMAPDFAISRKNRNFLYRGVKTQNTGKIG